VLSAAFLSGAGSSGALRNGRVFSPSKELPLPSPTIRARAEDSGLALLASIPFRSLA